MEIVQIVNTVFSSNTYVLREEGMDWCWLVDVGDVDPVLECIGGDVTIRGVFLTHAHYDHLYGINRLIDLFPQCVVYTSEAGVEGIYSDKLNFSKYHDDSVVFKGDHVGVVCDGDRIELFPGEFLTVLETPGHDKSCLTYYTESVVFSGDSFIPGVKVITTFPRSDKQEAARSVEKILKLAEGRDLYPGHGDVTAGKIVF
ncbi:MBL fold metallo-hydrolase [Butyricimonas virosa]|jgi:hypothetical protein|uniref:MBL fold metallo-hydrolase n=1 Tax=Butyricimonas virosa TaxID=544645 RepID=A0A413INW9_9BACT|nr:MBL fold metallo-hydrolase [Butyricimonas virosa]MCI7295649.1 MBL fold metallo-hydrolase [Butyricimonas virosa]MCI7391219.1 MBL fold metallo-hydrolase [Butyricimonas virosa]MDY4906058.1 MBL fold metallo-hydrolase [Butyricimonas virosa]MDY5487442.1 MBL fold metallo-hydrolase [Butyricimonas virosa]MDY6220480.1 MBL fold metallo-hydrolase [Butyricimonas virosa]